jgi:hypothetical protein
MYVCSNIFELQQSATAVVFRSWASRDINWYHEKKIQVLFSLSVVGADLAWQPQSQVWLAGAVYCGCALKTLVQSGEHSDSKLQELAVY